MLKVFFVGLFASLFFAATFILNRAMDLSGGSWIWSASLRYLFTVPFLLFIVGVRRDLSDLMAVMKAQPLAWLGWSTVGFGFFYAPLCFASAYGPAWLVAGTWQITIVAGSLLVPLFYEEVETIRGTEKKRQHIPLKEILTSILILLGIALIQNRGNEVLSRTELIGVILPILVAAFSYPLGNRKMMALCQNQLNVYQRVLGMTLASLPFWVILAIYGMITEGLPHQIQVAQAFIVAVFSGIIATVLFFYATDQAKGDPQKLAVVEATQAGEVLFTVIGEALFLAGTLPTGWAWGGLAVIITGMILHSLNLRLPKVQVNELE